MKVQNSPTNILMIASMTVLVGLCVLAQSKEDSAAARVLIAETSSTASHSRAKPAGGNRAPDAIGKTKSAASASTDDETKPETKASQAPPLASVPVSQPKELPFKLNDRNELATEAPSASGLLLRTFGALLFIVGLIAAAGWGLRYFGVINFGKQQGETAGLRVLDTVPLGERRTLTLVKFGERTLLIGSTPQGLTLLAEQADEAEPQSSYMPTVRTVTDLLDVNAAPPFEQEMARASLINTTWSDRSRQ